MADSATRDAGGVDHAGVDAATDAAATDHAGADAIGDATVDAAADAGAVDHAGADGAVDAATPYDAALPDTWVDYDAGAPAPEISGRNLLVHVFERRGRVGVMPDTYNSQIHLTYVGGLAGLPYASGDSVEVQVFLQDANSGAVVRSARNYPVCGPCSYTLSSAQRRAVVDIDSLFVAAGDLPQPQLDLVARVVVGGDTPELVGVQGVLLMSHAAGLENTIQPLDAVPVSTASATRLHLIPHLVDSQGDTDSDAYAIDSRIELAYLGGLGLVPGGGGATVDVWLLDTAGAPLHDGNGNEVCNPCRYDLSASQRAAQLDLQNLLAAARPAAVVTTWAVVKIDGADPGPVAIDSLILNSHASADDLSLALVAAQPFGQGAATDTRYDYPLLQERPGRISTTTYALDTQLYAVYGSGIADSVSPSGATIDLYLVDASGAPAQSETGLEICNPCRYTLDAAHRKQGISIEDAAISQGGFPTLTMHAPRRGYVQLSGDVTGVRLGGWTVNSLTGPFDLELAPLVPRGATSSPHAGVFVLPWLLERSGHPAATAYTLDDMVLAELAPGSPAAQIDLYLIGADGAPSRSSSYSPVCDPCTFQLDGMLATSVEELYAAQGGMPQPVTRDLGIVVVSGAGADRVNLEPWTMNSWSQPGIVSQRPWRPIAIPVQ